MRCVRCVEEYCRSRRETPESVARVSRTDDIESKTSWSSSSRGGRPPPWGVKLSSRCSAGGRGARRVADRGTGGTIGLRAAHIWSRRCHKSSRPHQPPVLLPGPLAHLPACHNVQGPRTGVTGSPHSLHAGPGAPGGGVSAEEP
ncbi:hypothetical protein AAFF_G00154400 [Aldrovandia affinis]|uniref:Uncharacterized protein n=1 Tax=Aldrovandia affinis TaxID=143900 RepID=A0AAD7T107_9TELE|nr:hypothetical protein AAFF_G00154400 [Aldrovandia affinis]